MNEHIYILIAMVGFIVGVFVYHNMRINGKFEKFKRKKK